MSRTFRYALPLVLGLVLGAQSLAAQAQAAPPGFREEFLRQFRNSAFKFIELAEAMPDSAYAWSPGEGVMPVGQVYGHVARYNYYYPDVGLGARVPEGVDPAALEGLRDKARLVAALRASAQHVRTLVEQMPESAFSEPARLYDRDTTKWAVLLQLVAHMNEHLGQSIAYARMNGVVPPWSR